jgi:tight adherence protein B
MKKTDYGSYRLTKLQLLYSIAVHMLLMLFISMLFYNSVVAMLFLMPFEIFLLRNTKQRKCEARKKQLYMEFNEMIYALAANMSAGYALEKAFAAVYEEMENLYQGKSYIEEELKIIMKGIEMNEDREDLLADFGVRSDISDIKEFAQVVKVAKSSGGNLVKIIKRTSENISRKFEVENEIDTVISAKKLEQKIMTAMPCLIICYLRLTNRGYMDILYHNFQGICFMSMCLGVIWVSHIWGKKIISIKV